MKTKMAVSRICPNLFMTWNYKIKRHNLHLKINKNNRFVDTKSITTQWILLECLIYVILLLPIYQPTNMSKIHYTVNFNRAGDLEKCSVAYCSRGRTSAFILLDSGTSKVKSLLVRQKVY